jgi:hypothetical protein
MADKYNTQLDKQIIERYKREVKDGELDLGEVAAAFLTRGGSCPVVWATIRAASEFVISASFNLLARVGIPYIRTHANRWLAEISIGPF